MYHKKRRLGDYTPLPYPPRGGCDGASTAGSLISVASKTGMAIAPLTGPAAPFVAMGASLLSLFGGHHAAAVKKESELLCANVPAANQALQAIYDAVKSGQATPDQGAASLDKLQSDFASAVAPIAKGTFGTDKCNGACLYKGWLAQAAQQMKSEFSQMSPAADAAPGGGASNAGSTITNLLDGFTHNPMYWAYGLAGVVGIGLIKRLLSGGD